MASRVLTPQLTPRPSLRLKGSVPKNHYLFQSIIPIDIIVEICYVIINDVIEKSDEIQFDPSSSVTEFSLEELENLEVERRSSKVTEERSNEVIRKSKRSFRQDSYEITIHGHSTPVTTPLSVSASPLIKRNC